MNLLNENDRTNENLAGLLEPHDLVFLAPLLRIQSLLWQALRGCAGPQDFEKYIKESLDTKYYVDPGFIHALVTVVVKYITEVSELRSINVADAWHISPVHISREPSRKT